MFIHYNLKFLLLVFQILAQQDEIARLKKQEESQTRVELEKIKGGSLSALLYMLMLFSNLFFFNTARISNIDSVSLQGLEDELEEIRNQIREKTLLLDTSDLRIANLCMFLSASASNKEKSHYCIKIRQVFEFIFCVAASQIMELHNKIQPLEDEISDLKEAHSENLEGRAERF